VKDQSCTLRVEKGGGSSLSNRGAGGGVAGLVTILVREVIESLCTGDCDTPTVDHVKKSKTGVKKDTYDQSYKKRSGNQAGGAGSSRRCSGGRPLAQPRNLLRGKPERVFCPREDSLLACGRKQGLYPQYGSDRAGPKLGKISAGGANSSRRSVGHKDSLFAGRGKGLKKSYSRGQREGGLKEPKKKKKMVGLQGDTRERGALGDKVRR